MKYKNIDSAIHNLGHSFMSGMNYFDDDHLMHEVREIVRHEPHELWINLSTGEIEPKSGRTARLTKSVAHYRSGLEDYLRRNNVDPLGVKDITLHHKLTKRGSQTIMLAIDDRGVQHRVVVKNTS